MQHLLGNTVDSGMAWAGAAHWRYRTRSSAKPAGADGGAADEEAPAAKPAARCSPCATICAATAGTQDAEVHIGSVLDMLMGYAAKSGGVLEDESMLHDMARAKSIARRNGCQVYCGADGRARTRAGAARRTFSLTLRSWERFPRTNSGRPSPPASASRRPRPRLTPSFPRTTTTRSVAFIRCAHSSTHEERGMRVEPGTSSRISVFGSIVA